MLTGPFLDRNWMGQNEDYKTSNIVMLGMPFDGTVSYRPGSRFAPEQIRLASWGLEEYSPYFDKHLEDCNFHDAGDLEFPLGNTEKSLEVIKNNVEEIYRDGKRVFGIGGEHLVTLPEIQAVSKYVDNLAIVHFDAHTDLREEYLGEPLSHSAVIRHSAEIVGFENLKQIGIRSGMKEEFELMKKYGTLIHEHSELDCFKNKNIFVKTYDKLLANCKHGAIANTEPEKLKAFAKREFTKVLESCTNKEALGANLDKQIFKLKAWKSLGSFAVLLLTVKPIDMFTENIIIKKCVKPQMDYFNKQHSKMENFAQYKQEENASEKTA